jgi:hypothetical protein
MQPGTLVPTFRDEYELHVRNYERCSKTKWWSGLDTDEYEMGNVGTLFSAMPWYSDFITKFHRKRVSDPSKIGIEYLWTKADHMNEAYERSLTEDLAKKFKTAESVNAFSSTPPSIPDPDLRYSNSGPPQGWYATERTGGKSGKGSSGLKGGGFREGRGKGTDPSRNGAWNMPQHQSGGKSFGKGQDRLIGYGKGASSSRWSDRSTQDDMEDLQRSSSPPPKKLRDRCFTEENYGSCTNADCQGTPVTESRHDPQLQGRR